MFEKCTRNGRFLRPTNKTVYEKILVSLKVKSSKNWSILKIYSDQLIPNVSDNSIPNEKVKIFANNWYEFVNLFSRLDLHLISLKCVGEEKEAMSSR